MEKELDRKLVIWDKKNILVSLLLVLISTSFFYYINSNIEDFHNWPTLKYKSGDSTTYLKSGQWFLGEVSLSEVERSVAIRPFFYSVIVALFEKVSPWSLQAFQFLLWVAQIILVFFCGILISGSKTKSFFLSLCCVAILSPVGISLHALSETTVSFLLISSVFFLIYYLSNTKSNVFLFLHLLMLSLSSVTKPLYFYLFILDIVFLYFTSKNNRLIYIFFIVMTFSPVVFQIVIMSDNFNLKKISFIDTVTINAYFITRLNSKNISSIKNIDIDRVIPFIRKKRREYIDNNINKKGYRYVDKMIRLELYENMRKYPLETAGNFLYLIWENSLQPSFFLFSKKEKINDLFFRISFIQSKILLFSNVISLFLLSILIVKKVFSGNLFFWGTNFFLFCGIFLSYASTGVTFWQGDRFLIPIYELSFVWFFLQLQAAVHFFIKKKV
ncbi:MAG: hypothetical protein SD837_12530 [Candidatus Electrothrix scaldis]|nr:MAG: hypothetical protein SD837_12530 [Candidatus Electrothrix sp. GW3-3]